LIERSRIKKRDEAELHLFFYVTVCLYLKIYQTKNRIQIPLLVLIEDFQLKIVTGEAKRAYRQAGANKGLKVLFF
jgi:hypothetical protein